MREFTDNQISVCVAKFATHGMIASSFGLLPSVTFRSIKNKNFFGMIQ